MNSIYIIFTFLLLSSFSVKQSYSNYNSHFTNFNQNDTLQKKKDTIIEMCDQGRVIQGQELYFTEYI